MSKEPLDYDFDLLRATVEVAREAHAEYDRLVLRPQRQLKAAHPEVCADYAEAKREEEAERARFDLAYAYAASRRLARISAGEEVDEPELPDGVTLTVRKRLEVSGVVPPEYCSPDPKKIQAALDAGVDVPGARYVPAYSVTVK